MLSETKRYIVPTTKPCIRQLKFVVNQLAYSRDMPPAAHADPSLRHSLHLSRIALCIRWIPFNHSDRLRHLATHQGQHSRYVHDVLPLLHAGRPDGIRRHSVGPDRTTHLVLPQR